MLSFYFYKGKAALYFTMFAHLSIVNRISQRVVYPKEVNLVTSGCVKSESFQQIEQRVMPDY